MVRNKIIPQSKFVRKVLFCVAFRPDGLFPIENRVENIVLYRVLTQLVRVEHKKHNPSYRQLCHFSNYQSCVTISQTS